jgi:hypothetical protein
MKISLAIATALCGALAAGCAQTLPPPQPSLAALETLRAGALPRMHTGTFAPAPGMRPDVDAHVTVRSVILSSPYDGSFAKYLAKTVDADLGAGGKFDPNSDLVIGGLLTDSNESDGMSEGHAELAAKFTLTKGGKVIFEKDLSVDAHWDSNFVGAVAIPDAINNYASLYDKLAIRLFEDKDFAAAASGMAALP